MNELLQRVLRTDGASAARLVKSARLVRREVDLSSGEWLPARWPALREALLDGAIGVTGLLAATGPIEQAGPRVRLADRWEADAYLAEVARGEESCEGAENSDDDENETGPAPTPEDLRVRAQMIVQYLDPDGAEPAEDIALRARGVVLGRAKDGVIPVRGALLPEVAGQLQRIWDAYLNPKVDGPPLPGVHFVPSEVRDDAAGEQQARSPRMTMCFRPATSAGWSTGAHAHRSSTTRSRWPWGSRPGTTTCRGWAVPRRRSWSRSPPRTMPRGTAGRGSRASRRRCRRGWPAHGVRRDSPARGARCRRKDRRARVERPDLHPAQRRAIGVRDGECLIPGCHVPAAWCEIHHVTEHARGVRPTPTTASRCAGTITARWTPRAGRSACEGSAAGARAGLVGSETTMAHAAPGSCRLSGPDGARFAHAGPVRGRILRAGTSPARSATSAAGRADRE